MSDVPGSSTPPPPPDPPPQEPPPALSAPPAPPARTTSTPPGWHPDPFGRYEHRWFDGTVWTDQVSTNGQPGTDPSGTAPGSAGPAGPGGFRYDGSPGKNGIAVAALVCGIIGVLIAWMPFVVAGGIVFAALALIFGIIGLRRSRERDRGRGQAIAGIVTGGVGLALSVLGIFLTVVFWRAVSDFIEPGNHDATIADCRIEGGFATVTGTLTNESSTTRSYTLFVEVDGRTEPITIDDLEPDAVDDWLGRVRADGEEGAACEAEITVNGPFPFGIEIDPIDQ